MKVLFAVSNENISESIVKKYQQQYKEIISYKNVYYFNAIVKELQRDKTYDRIVISEDLEPFSNNNYEEIDRFLFEKLDSISDEAANLSGTDIPIILICTDRREKQDNILLKIFGIGIYSALIGNDRSIDNVCKLINKPRIKKEAKVYYNIDSEDVNYKSESEEAVSEIEIQNILDHYKRLGRNEDRYIDSFNSIAAQYNDAQLRLIARFLPLNVKAVLEAESPKYQEIVLNGKIPDSPRKYEPLKKEKKTQVNGKLLETNRKKTTGLDFIGEGTKLTKPVVIPTEVSTVSVKKIQQQEYVEPEVQEKEETKTQKRGRGRPKKVETVVEEEKQENNVQTSKKRRGRPRKQPIQEENEDLNLFDLDNQDVEQEDTSVIMPGIEEVEEPIEEQPVKYENYSVPNTDNTYTQNYQDNYSMPMESYSNSADNVDITNLIANDKKIVGFVGTTKNGTSFLVNNVAQILSERGINTAILDLTTSKNAYYIYTENEESLRNTAYECVNKLRMGVPAGIQVNKNLTVYTTVPDSEEKMEDYSNILTTLVQNYTLVLLDCDFKTPYEYFRNVQELYLVQSMDILTIQPLTAFLRELKAKNVLDPNKLKIVINKEMRVRSLTEKLIIGGMAYYNDPSMSVRTELFNKDNAKYCTIPFDMQVCSKYLEGLVNCKISLNGYPKNFMLQLENLVNMVFPLLTNKQGFSNNRNYNNYNKNTNGVFSNKMNNTLNRMKKNY